MSEKVKKTKTSRHPYRKPQLEEVRLVPEEAVLQSCKLIRGGGFGPNNHHCRGASGPGGICHDQGS